MKIMSTITATIANGQTTSGEIDLRGRTLYAIYMPDAFTGTALTFTGCHTSGGTFRAIYDQTGNAVSITVAQQRVVSLVDEHLAVRAVPFVKVVSGSAEGAERSLVLLLVDE